MDGEASDFTSDLSRVPQGTVLGPLLFLMFRNDLPESTVSKTCLFADDAVLYKQIKDINDSAIMQNDLDSLAIWEKKWQMTFHPQMCNGMHSIRSRKPIKTQYTLKGNLLETVSQAAYLGVELDAKLTWSPQTNKVTAKSTRTLNFVTRNVRVASQSVKETAYKSLVRPALDYACTVWGPYTAVLTNTVEMVQHRATRYVCSRYHNSSSVSGMIEQLGWDTLEERRAKYLLCMFYKVVNGLLDIPAGAYLQEAKPLPSHNHLATYIQQQARTQYYQYSYFPRNIPEWNRLPEAIAMAPNSRRTPPQCQ